MWVVLPVFYFFFLVKNSEFRIAAPLFCRHMNYATHKYDLRIAYISLFSKFWCIWMQCRAYPHLCVHTQYSTASEHYPPTTTLSRLPYLSFRKVFIQHVLSEQELILSFLRQRSGPGIYGQAISDYCDRSRQSRAITCPVQNNRRHWEQWLHKFWRWWATSTVGQSTFVRSME